MRLRQGRARQRPAPARRPGARRIGTSTVVAAPSVPANSATGLPNMPDLPPGAQVEWVHHTYDQKVPTSMKKYQDGAQRVNGAIGE